MPVTYMLAGAVAMASAIIALFFLRFWRNSKDRFFLYFSLSFGIEALHRVYAAMTFEDAEDSPLHYLVRLLSYGLILLAILHKNLPSRRPRD
jgi:hypothetical protein